MIRSLVIGVLLLQTSFLFAAVQKGLPDTVLPGSMGRELPGIMIKRKPALGKATGDTVHFHAGRFMTAGVFRLEDLVKNIPGFRVDDNGRIYFNGKEINRIMIDGDDMAIDQYQLLSKNLKALMVDSLQVIHRFEKNRLLRTFGSPDAIAVNLVIKKSLLGRLNGSIALSKDPGQYGEANAELIRLMPSSKQLLFLNDNNIGADGVADRGDGAPTTNSSDYKVWPFERPGRNNAIGLPATYFNMNKTFSLAGVASFALSKITKLKMSSTALHTENNSWTRADNQYQVPGTGDILIQSTTDERHNMDAGKLRIDLETDKGNNTVSSFRLTLNPQQIQLMHAGTRKGLGDASSKQDERRFRFGWHAAHQFSWKLTTQALVQIETKLEVDGNNASFRSTFLKGNAAPLFIEQALVHGGKMISTDVALIKAGNQYQLRTGFIASLQNIRSSSDEHPLRLGILKYYPYTDFVYRVAKKITASIGAASGATHASSNGMRRAVFVFQVNQQWVWQRKPVEKYHLGFSASRKNSDPKQWHAGPLTVGNMVWTGTQALAFPVSVGAEGGMTKMDLFKGYTVAINASLGIVRNDHGISTRLGTAFDSLQWFIVPVQKNFLVNGYAEQFIHGLKLKYSINANGMVVHMPQMLNGIIFGSTLRSLGIEQRLVSNWKRAFNAEMYFSRYASDLVAVSTNRLPLVRLQYGLKAGFQVRSNIFTQLHCVLYKNGTQTRFFQFDGMLRAKINAQWNCSVVMSNLLNSREYQERSISAYGNSQMVQSLNGRRILFGLRWNF